LIFSTILYPRFDELGTLLAIDPRKAEKIAANMIGQDRMRGSIDQVSNKKYFVG